MRPHVSEQDTVDEIFDCAQNIVRYSPGIRLELPPFGVTDQSFSQQVDGELLREQVFRWEDRADISIIDDHDRFDDLTHILRTRVASGLTA